MSTLTHVPGFKAIPQELLNTPKPCLMTVAELRRTLAQLKRMGLIEEQSCADAGIRYHPTRRGQQIMRRSG